MRDATAGAPVVEIDLGGADEVDGGVIALLYVDFAARGVPVGIDGGDRFRSLLELYAVCATAPRPGSSVHRSDSSRTSGERRAGRSPAPRGLSVSSAR